MQKKQVSFFDALLTIMILAIVMSLSITVYKTSPHIPMLIGCATASLVSLKNGYKWVEIEEGMIKGIVQALKSMIILMLIGIMIGIWIEAGIVPSIIYYGLKILSPRFFLVSVMLICSIISMALGSWGTAGTIGLAFMGMSHVMGIPPYITAGAIVSGAYFGDKVSPMSDSTNLASGVTGVDIFAHVRHMFPVVGLAYVISGLVFTFIGLGFNGNSNSMENIKQLLSGLKANFDISPLLFIPFVIIILCVLLKVPSIPSIASGIFSAVIISVLFQGTSIQEVLNTAFYGHVSSSGDAILDNLLTAGGLENMMFSVSMIIMAMMFGGIMEYTGLMDAFMAPVFKKAASLGTLTGSAVLSCIIINMIMPEQYIAITIPGRMYAGEYKKHNIDLRELTRALGAGGAATSPLVPWNTCGLFMMSVLGVSAFSYAPFAILNLLTPVIVILDAFIRSKKHGYTHDVSKKQAEI